MHTGMLRIGKEEMHKSLGNFIGATEIMAKYDPDVLRVFAPVNVLQRSCHVLRRSL